MKKYVLTSIIIMSINILTAQWVSDPAQNTLLATGSSDYGEILLSTNPQSANTYIQWCGSHSNGWSPSIQMVDSAGNPMWGANGIAAIQADDCLRTEVVACHNGGFWILTSNDNNIYLRFYQSDGTPGGSQITISDPRGLLVGEPDNINFHGMPSASLEPNSHDLLVAFVETDAVTQTHNAIRVNRVTTNGTKLWGPNGNVIVPTTSHNISNLIIDAFPDGTWSSIIYKYDENIVQAVGINSLGTLIWDTTMSTASGNSIALSAASSGYNNHQTIVAWEGTRNDTFGMYGQNLQKNGVMGPVVINDDDSGDDSGDDDSTAVQNFDLNRINIYQNGNCLHIDGQDFQQVEVFSLMGQLILSDNTGKHDIALGGIPQGIYIVRARTANGKTVNRKVMIR